MRAYLSDLAMARPNGGPYGAIMGTPGFIPPEVLIGGEDTMPSYAGDVYRTACTIWQVCLLLSALSAALTRSTTRRLCQGSFPIGMKTDVKALLQFGFKST
jgi:serine/threonine protein kinase